MSAAVWVKGGCGILKSLNFKGLIEDLGCCLFAGAAVG
ncbi:hypothetical protein AIOL_001736 [Candidatus Rhodobacter oscarellae]|uniref:Uncharacterized protein n=1 Tax=Candidatus Rhodobacter oscarellae TaxID=1675527 RepID=A0A0J9E227_9RHOB|nr:hypothetical protein AIOL_001736 [Candidatus Rhodobacter lobularis]